MSRIETIDEPTDEQREVLSDSSAKIERVVGEVQALIAASDDVQALKVLIDLYEKVDEVRQDLNRQVQYNPDEELPF